MLLLLTVVSKNLKRNMRYIYVDVKREESRVRPKQSNRGRKITAAVVAGWAFVLSMGCLKGVQHRRMADRIYTAGNVRFVMKQIAVVKGALGHADEHDNEPHTMRLSAYSIGETEVTQELWQAVMGSNPSGFITDPLHSEIAEWRPVERVSWFMCIAFCNELTKKVYNGSDVDCVYYSDADFSAVYTKDNAEKGAIPYVAWHKKGFRLPTEAEWEWAAKGGMEDKWAGTDDPAELVDYAWYSNNYGGDAYGGTHEVKKKKANGYGLYDMSGNVWEWCWDWYSTVPESPKADYTGAASGLLRVGRGGCWNFSTRGAARAYRDNGNPHYASTTLGLRVVCR